MDLRSGRLREAKRGVAVIIVLGLLAVILLLGVAFSINMRSERMGAGNWKQNVAGRQLLWAALSWAMDDINFSITNAYAAGHGNLVYPSWTNDILASAGSKRTRLAYGDALKYLPDAFRQATNNPSWPDANTLRRNVAGTSAGWFEVGDATEDTGVRGGCAYLAVNCSGYLDANVVGGASRGMGANPQEIAIWNLSDIVSIRSYTNSRLIPDRRYETGVDLETQQCLRSGGGMARTNRNFVTYSHCPTGWYDTNTASIKMPLQIGGGVDLNDARLSSAIIRNLIDSGIDAAQAPFVLMNLLDYVDIDCEPRDLASACTEAVPMINEVRIQGGLQFVPDATGAGPLTMNNAEANVEVFYPFVVARSNTFSLHAEVTWIVTNTTTSRGMTASDNSDRDTRYGGGTNWLSPAIRLRGPSDLQVAASNGHDVAVILQFRGRIELDGAGGTTVDAVPWPWNGQPLTNTFSQALTNGAGTYPFAKSMECYDPRFNWRPTDPLHWRAHQPGTMGPPNDYASKLNFWTQERINRQTASRPEMGIDRDTEMYVSDAGQLFSPGELGNLLRGNVAQAHRFCTIRLFDHVNRTNGLVARRDRVLDYFTCIPGDSPVKRGQVNPNTTNLEVLTSVFAGVPLYYPPSAARVGAAFPVAFASNLAARIIGPRQRFVNVSDIGDLDWRSYAASIYPGRILSDLQTESIIGYSSQLLSTRQNLYVIYLAGACFAPGIGTVGHRPGSGLGVSRGGECRAVALVWRDPYPHMADPHRPDINKFKFPCFVQFLKTLESY